MIQTYPAIIYCVRTDRPINPAQERAEVLLALGAVDAVVIFDEDTPQAIIGRIQPDVLVKGTDWGADATEVTVTNPDRIVLADSRGVDLNRWLEDNGYLVFHDGQRFRPSRCLVVVPSTALERYVAGVLPALGVRGRLVRGLGPGARAAAVAGYSCGGLGVPPRRRNAGMSYWSSSPGR